jgi:penicillin-binding protein 2
MFERRLKIFLGILIGVTAMLLLRAAHLQLANGAYWRKQAAETLQRRTLVEPVRGGIVDFKNNVLAEDVACIDAAVDYRAIDLDPKWLKEQALSRLVARMGLNYRRAEKSAREKLVADETRRVQADIANMWKTLAKAAGKNVEDIEEVKNAIRRRIEMRQRSLCFRKYELAIKKEDARGSLPWYKDWRLGGNSNPDLDNFNIGVSEQAEAHVIVPNISTEVHNQLKKRLEQFPGLVLRPSKHRFYPYGEVACHVIGHLAPVELNDLHNDPNDGNELLEYYPNDKIGRSGAESLCELTLRGQRGRIQRLLGHDEIHSHLEARQGKTVRLTIDINLQMQIENAFKQVVWRDEQGVIVEDHEMHGGAVVIDIPTGEVRALVSYPTYDLNTIDDNYASLATDYVNRPLVNRATQSQLEPGSTVKPIVGIGAVSQGVTTLVDTVECEGYLVIDGRRQLHGRCWTASNFAKSKPLLVAHHQIPSYDPHPTGHLNLVDAIQRSCNVYFENMGNRLGIEGLSYWYSQFGLGSPTGIGLPEAKGKLPRSFKGSALAGRQISWYAGIGQGQIWATPIQMANVAATIGRNGTWVRPRLVTELSDIARPTTQPSTQPATPDRVALPVSMEAITAVQEGMYRVVNTPAGSATILARKDIVICGKTGTAQAQPLRIPMQDASGKIMTDEKGNDMRYTAQMSTRAQPNEKMPWYRGDGENSNPHHAWFIGYAPRENPTVAFAIMLEYGGTGGHDAASISKAVLDACIKHGYLR